MDVIEEFKEAYPSLDSYWRSVILFGRNVASYKFALAKSLITLADEGKTDVTLEELAVPYTKNLCEHIKNAPRQATSNTSTFIETCKSFNEGKTSYDKMISTATSLGFNNVIDAFHIVNRAPIPIEFYKKDYSGSQKKIILTDNIYKLREMEFSDNFIDETEARWNLVETAWGIGISPALLNVKYDNGLSELFIDEGLKRKSVTSARAALDGYQKGTWEVACVVLFLSSNIKGFSN